MSDTSSLKQHPAQGMQEWHRASSATGHSLGWGKKLHISYLHHAILALWPQLQFLVTQGKMSCNCLSRSPRPFIPPFFINFQIFTKHCLKSPHLSWIKNKHFSGLKGQDSQQCQSWRKWGYKRTRAEENPVSHFSLHVCRWRQSLFWEDINIPR